MRHPHTRVGGVEVVAVVVGVHTYGGTLVSPPLLRDVAIHRRCAQVAAIGSAQRAGDAQYTRADVLHNYMTTRTGHNLYIVVRASLNGHVSAVAVDVTVAV